MVGTPCPWPVLTTLTLTEVARWSPPLTAVGVTVTNAALGVGILTMPISR